VKSKYIVVTGGVLSSVGKGTVSASLGLLLKEMGLRITLVKVDPYINVDAGTMNPYMHGEVFVTEDGAETDLDLGHYERFADIDMSKYNNITAGKVYFEVIRKEREGKYLGQTVQIIPHVTDEIKSMIHKASQMRDAQVTIVEIGGTVGDIEGLPFLEAVRQMKLEDEEGVIFVHVALVEYLKATGELKTKPLQHSVQELRRIGIQPDIIIARAEVPLDEESRRKIALFTNVKPEFVFSSYDVDTSYEVPSILQRQGLHRKVISKLQLSPLNEERNPLESFVSKMRSSSKEVKIALVGKYVKLKDSYISIREALYHAGVALDVRPKIKWIEAEELEGGKVDVLEEAEGIIVLPGFGSRGVEGKIEAVRFAREKDVPFLGICYGFQLAVVEFARNVLGLRGAHTTEVDAETPHPVVTVLEGHHPVKGMGGTMRLGAQTIHIKEGSILHKIYGSVLVTERHRHRYEVNPNYIKKLEEGGLTVSGVSDNGLVEFVELKGHRFFVGSQPHPEYKSRPLHPSPIYMAFLAASAKLEPEVEVAVGSR
jgi:CTP synthase